MRMSTNHGMRTMRCVRQFLSLTCCAALLFLFASIDAKPLRAAEPTTSKEAAAAGTSSGKGKISLVEMAPELYYQMWRYPKFYGDENTVHGGLLERSFLLDNIGGARDVMLDHGIYFDASVTQFLQSNVSGGKDTGSGRYNGTADYWLALDTGKAGLWSAGAFMLHAESSWQADRSVNSDTGALLPANFDATMPVPGQSKAIVLSEAYLVQALPHEILLTVGKVNFAGLGDSNLFANNERTQFSYTGLVNNPILGAFIPYTPLGVAGVWQPSKEHQLVVLAVQSTGKSTITGFDNFNGNYTYGGQYTFSPMVGGKPGHYLALAGYNTKDVPSFDIDPRHLIGEIIGLVPVAQKSGNSAFLINFDQYLWVKGGSPAAAGRKHLPPVGIGIFGRAGWSPKDRNVIDQFYSFGIGGYGMLIPGRDNDQWGLGWAGTHISSDLRNALGPLGSEIDSFENAGEVFYNIQVTPAVHLTLNAQVIEPVLNATDTAFTLGSRLQLDF